MYHCEGSLAYVDFIFYDTNPFVKKYWNETEHTYDWRGIEPKQQFIDNELQVHNSKKLHNFKHDRLISENIIFLKCLFVYWFYFLVSIILAFIIKCNMEDCSWTPSHLLCWRPWKHGWARGASLSYPDGKKIIWIVLLTHFFSWFVLQIWFISQEHKVDLYVNGHDHCLEHITRRLVVFPLQMLSLNT